MKKIICLIVFTGFGCCLFAQKTDTMMHNNMDKMSMHKMKDCVYMENDHMMVMKSGKPMMMDKDMKMSNGTTVMKDGSMMMKDGSKRKLMNGECVDMNGKMSKMKMDDMKMMDNMKDSMQ
jgi:hypothetical protein